MKKGIAVIIGIVLAVLLVFAGIFIGINIRNNNQSKGITYILKQARSKAANVKDRDLERVEIENIGTSKYQSIVILQSEINKKAYGTGFIVSKNKILTNKHVTDQNEKNLVARLRNKNGELIDFNVVNVINAPNRIDLSIVEVAPNDAGENIGDNVKMLEFATQEEINNVKVDDSIHVVGYPGDKNFSTLWYSPGKILHKDEALILNDSLITGGNSGSPMLNKDGKIIGLINASTDDDKKVVTYGFLLNKELYEFIKSNI